MVWELLALAGANDENPSKDTSRVKQHYARSYCRLSTVRIASSKIYSKWPGPKQGNTSVLPQGMEGRNEVNDGRKACIDQKLCPRLPQERQEGEGGSADGVYGDDGLQPLLWGLSAAPRGQADPVLSPKVVAVGDVGKRVPRQRARKYDQNVLEALETIWEVLDYLCGRSPIGLFDCSPGIGHELLYGIRLAGEGPIWDLRRRVRKPGFQKAPH